MNILLTTCEGYRGTGSTFSIASLATGLAQRGHSVLVACRKESLLFQILQGTDVKTEVVHFKSKISWSDCKDMAQIVKRNNVEIINAQSSKDRYITYFAKLFFNLKCLIVHTRRQTPRSNGGALQRWFYLSITEKIIVVSHELKEIFIKKGYPAHHLHVIFNGINPQYLSYYNPGIVEELRNKHGINENDIVIGCVSRLKKQEQLIKALKYLEPTIKVIFLGIKPGCLDDVINREGIRNQIIYAGTVDKQTIMNYYKLFTVTVLPSTTEGFSQALLESMGMGIPVVGTRAAGIIDALESEKNGLWFEDGNPEQMALKIKQVLYDHQLRKKLIANGIEAAHKRFTLENTINGYEQFFACLIYKQPLPVRLSGQLEMING